MRTILALSAASLAIAGAAPAVAQERDASVNSYLCQFAGKCDTAQEVTPVKAAPATKGFRLAAPQVAAVTPTQAAPATKGFRLAMPQAAQMAPLTKSVRVAHEAPVLAAPVARVRTVASRPAATSKRANLMLAFEYNSDEMTPSAQAKAKIFAQALMSPELKDKHFLIEGHTDARGAHDLNVDLSRRRAQSVANFLIAQGVDSHSVEVRGVGSDEPLPGQAASAEANRRVEAVLLS